MSGWENQFSPAIRPGLYRMRALMERLGSPHTRVPMIHVAGTNGKGSTAVMITAGLSAAGYRVGLTVSPDLGRVNDRILIDGEPIADGQAEQLADAVKAAGREIGDAPTRFEAIVAVALLAFRQREVDLAVVEVGLGGRLDATNVIPAPLVAVITPIHFDHMALLGHRIEQIAAEKAGILKPGSTLVLADQPHPAAAEAIMRRARELGVEIRRPRGEVGVDAEGPWYCLPEGERLRSGLVAAYQAQNLATAWTVLEVLAEGGWKLDWQRATEAIASTRWPGRFDVISHVPLTVFDGAHNPEAAQALVDSLSVQPWQSFGWHLLFGGLADKAVHAMLKILEPGMRSVTLTSVSGRRGMDPLEVAQQWRGDRSLAVIAEPSQAYASVRQRALAEGPQAAVLVTGSLAFLADLLTTDAAG